MPAESAKPERNMLLRQVGRTLVVVQNSKTPSDAEWAEFLKSVAVDPPGLRLFVMTDGGAPSATQRKQLQATLRGAMPLVAAVSDSVKVRFVAATIALFHRTHGSYSLDEVSKAYDHLGLNGQERREVETAARELKERLT
jgi:hypothetical protein